MTNCSDGKSCSDDDNRQKAIVVKPEVLDFELPPESTMYPMHVGDNLASSSSGSNLRSSFIAMGFLPSLVDRVIEEKGEDNVDLLLETLFEYGDIRKSDPQSSDSLDSLFDDKDASSPPESATFMQPKEEPDVCISDDKRASLLTMNFSVNEIEFAFDKLGEHAPIGEVVDFIVAAQIAEKLEKEVDGTHEHDEEMNEDSSNEALFGTMEKTLRLLEMGFSESEVSSAIEKFGSNVPISELADSIFAGQMADNGVGIEKYYGSFGVKMEDRLDHSNGTVKIKTEDFSADFVPQSRYTNVEDTHKGKRPKTEYMDDGPDSVSQFRHIDFDENVKGKRLKQQYMDGSSSFLDSTWPEEEKVDPRSARFGMHKEFKSNICKSLDQMVAKSPYFFYGNVVNVSFQSWTKISQFLYAIEPEFVNTQFFSALSRREGYLHNLPTENRFHILPKPAMTIKDAIPHTKKWWPPWDPRKHLSCISSEASGISQLCDRLGKILTDSRGLLSQGQQRDILNQCQRLNLVWVGPYKLGPVEPEHLESILGYPQNHTQAAESSLIDRLQSLKYCFQTDTLGYHLSVLKPMFPGGITMLSLFTGIGGAEVTLHRLGIHLKGVVSVETSEAKRRILKRWWQSSEQTGELVQLEDIEKLTTKKVDSLVEKLGGFDFIICQNPCTHNSKSLKKGADDDNSPSFDFSLFCEFVRVLQRVRSTMERRR